MGFDEGLISRTIETAWAGRKTVETVKAHDLLPLTQLKQDVNERMRVSWIGLGFDG